MWTITRYLAWFTSQVRIESKSGYLDIAKYSEGFLIPILNQIFDKKFVKLEYIKVNYPAIDLGSADKSISIQVTSEKGFGKIKKTLSKFINKKEFEKFTEIYHLVINEDYSPSKTDSDISKHVIKEFNKLKPKIDPSFKFLLNKHLINITKLRALIEEKCKVEQLEEIKNYLERQYGKVTSLPTFQDMLIPYEIAFEAQLNVTNKNLPHQFHSPFFGRTDDVDKVDTFINNSNRNILAIVSDGGYGKTRLVIELFKKYNGIDSNTEAYLLNEVAFKSLDFAIQLKTQKNVLILFDDAHKKPEILNDIIRVAESLPNVKVILTIRKNALSETLKSISTHNRIMDTIELNRLSYEETQLLFKSQLKGLNNLEIRKMSQDSRGVPLVILGLCQNVLNGKHQSNLSEEENFVEFVSEIKEEVISEIHSKFYVSKEKINKTIQLISLFSPIGNTSSEIEELARLNSMEPEETSLIIDYLNDYGFVDRKYEISIKPDPYSDTIFLNSARRLIYLFENDISIFNDRLMRNLMVVDESPRLNLDVDSLLFEFVSSFKNKPVDSNEDIRLLESNLITLKTFAYKKPKICFTAVNYLIIDKIDSKQFWSISQNNSLLTANFNSVHNSIVTILSIVALNTKENIEFELIYNLMLLYLSKNNSSKIFTSVFRYRMYDFKEYGYQNESAFIRQDFLIAKLISRVDNEELTIDLFEHIISCCQIVLSTEFSGENNYDRFNQSFMFGNYYVISNNLINQIRENAIKLLIRVYKEKRYLKESLECFSQLTKFIFYMAKTNNDRYQINKKAELEIIITFLNEISEDSPSVIERSSILKNLRVYERRDWETDHFEVINDLINKFEKVENPKDQLKLVFLDDYFLVKNKIDEIIENIAGQYKNWDLFFQDIVEIRLETQNEGWTNFHEILNLIIDKYADKAKLLFDHIIDKHPNLICDYATLIKANYKDEEYFYGIIDRIWSLEYEWSKNTVVWMLSFGRNQDSSFYKESDLEFIESAMVDKLPLTIKNVVYSLPQFMSVAPAKVIRLLSQIAKLDNYKGEKEKLIYTLFTKDDLLEENKDLIKDFIFNATLDIPHDAHYFGKVLFFLESKFDINTLHSYLINRVNFLEKEGRYFSISIDRYYNNPDKSEVQNEVDFLRIVKWYANLETKNEYTHKKLVEYLSPSKLKTSEFRNGFQDLVSEAKDDSGILVSLFEAIDTSRYESYILKFKISMISELCEKINFSHDELIRMFTSKFIYNSGLKSKSTKGAFPSDLRKQSLLEDCIEKMKMHQSVKNVLLYSLERVKSAIKKDSIDDEVALW